MASREQVRALIRELDGARVLFEGGLVPDGLDALLDRLDGVGLAGLKDIPSGVRGLMEEGPLLGSLPMIAASLAISGAQLSLHLMELESRQ